MFALLLCMPCLPIPLCTLPFLRPIRTFACWFSLVLCYVLLNGVWTGGNDRSLMVGYIVKGIHIDY